jgi:hypothetical protein
LTRPVPAMAADSFRSQMNSLGWSRRDEPVNTSAPSPFLNKLQSLNPFGNGGYVRLPTTSDPPPQLPAQTRQEEDAGWLACELCFYQPCINPHGSRPNLECRGGKSCVNSGVGGGGSSVDTRLIADDRRTPCTKFADAKGTVC